MINTTQNIDEQRLQIKHFMSDRSWKQQALFIFSGYPKQNFSSILLGKQKGTPYANKFITAVCEAYNIDWLNHEQTRQRKIESKKDRNVFKRSRFEEKWK